MMTLKTKLTLILVLLMGISISISNSKGEARYVGQAASIYKHQTLDIDPFRWIVNSDTAFYEEHYYPPTPPGLSLLALPAVAVADLFYQLLPASGQSFLKRSSLNNYQNGERYVIRHGAEFLLADDEIDLELLSIYQLALILNRLTIALLSIALFFGCIRLFHNLPWKVSERALILAAFFSLAATFLMYYSNLVFWHVPVAAAMVWSLNFIHHSASGRHIFMAGFLAASLASLDYSSGVYGIILVCYGLWFFRHERRAQLFLLAGCLIPSIIFMGYHIITFGGPFTIAHSFIHNPAHKEGLYGLAIGSNVFAIAQDLFVSIDMGFLLYATFAVPGFFALWLLYKEPKYRGLAVTIATIFIVALLINLSFSLDYKGGTSSWGPRYLAITIPLLSIGAIWILSFARPITKKILLWVCVFSSVLHWLSMALQSSYNRNYDMNKLYYTFTALPKIIYEQGLSLPLIDVLISKGVVQGGYNNVTVVSAYVFLVLCIIAILRVPEK